MIKRGFTFGSYNTAAQDWTLTGWQLSPATQKTTYISKSGGDGSWDLSTAMTDGIPRYEDRTLTATFECSEGNRASREAKIKNMVNQLDGMRVNISLPDGTSHYLSGRLHVARNYSDLAHASVTVTATCEPWLYSNNETKVVLTATSTAQVAKIVNNGRRAVIPVVVITGTSVQLSFNGSSASLSAGTYRLPYLLLTPGTHNLNYTGVGTMTLTYREAVLE